MDDNNETGFEPEIGSEPTAEPKNTKKAKKGNTPLKVISFLLVLCIAYSAIQTVYIFRLNSGLTGITSYLSGNKKDDEDQSDDSDSQSADNAAADEEELADPWFSLEEAASVSDPNKETLSTTEIVDKVSPATLSINVMQGTDGSSAQKVAAGTGFIITSDGYIVTNQHVISYAMDDPDEYYLTVTLPNEEEPVKAEIIGGDTQTDIAVLKVDYDGNLPCVTLGDSDSLQAGELVVAIGNALGSLDDTVTVGVVSALDREINNEGYTLDVIQTDAAINSGNSGGPLINSFGEVIGITNAKIVTSSSENLGFAIPIDTVKEVIESIINYGKVVNRPYLGISVATVADGAYYGVDAGIYVGAIVKNGPGDKAGLEVGDKIVSIDGVEITESDDIIDVRDSHSVGDELTFDIVRDGEKMEVTLTVGDSGDYEDSSSNDDSNSSDENNDNANNDEQENGTDSGDNANDSNPFNPFNGK